MPRPALSRDAAHARRDAADCPVREALDALRGAWAPGVVGRLARGSARFGQLRTSLVRPDGTGVSAKVLTDELRRLGDAGVVVRTERSASSVSYRLTERGRALVPLLDALAEWAAEAPRPAPRRLGARRATPIS